MHETVGARIESLAATKKLPKNAELARLIGVSYETLRRWRAGEAAPNRKRQDRIAELLGVAHEVFMHGSAGANAGEPLRSDEARLLRAYRTVLKEDKIDMLKSAEARAREIEELTMRIEADKHTKRQSRSAA